MMARNNNYDYQRSGRDGFKRALQNDSFENGYDESRRFVEQNKAPDRGRRPRRGGGPSRQNFQKNRVSEFRSTQNNITEADLAEDLRRKLFPGVKNGQSAMERLDEVNTLRAITLTVTTRAIGFGTASIFASLYEFNNVPVRGTIFQLYRISLAILEVKVKVCQRSITSVQTNKEDYARLIMNEDMIQAVKGITMLPDQLTSVIKAVGKVKVGDKLYTPKFARDRYTDRRDTFIPQSENITFSNVRRVVLAVADHNTPIDYRRRFYRNSPIPGAIWAGGPNDPVLINPDEIMPDDYGLNELNDDIVECHAKLTFLAKKAPKYYTSAVGYEPEGTKAMLTCNRQGGLRVIDRRQGMLAVCDAT
ncbi:hypothetical protein RN001_005586 [Aquatica leii]|uniref:Uncharacterized protein n=1 Tax=Aquatica leii TaxID=1421715 RepID=A0AAN7PC35_9COLE|nr:hypothetical protein RN001_005586 [Aquatica leii]